MERCRGVHPSPPVPGSWKEHPLWFDSWPDVLGTPGKLALKGLSASRAGLAARGAGSGGVAQRTAGDQE